MSADLELPRLPLNGSFMPSAAIKSSYNGDFLQTTSQQGPIRGDSSDGSESDSQHYSKEIIKGFVIVLPMIAALLLAPMLLSYSRRRLFSRKKSRIVCCCRRKTTQNNRDDQRVIIEISEQNINDVDTSVKETVVEKFPMKPTLKKSKMFVETVGIASDPSETQVEEAEAPDVENASGRCFPEISLVNFGAKMLDRRRCDEGQSTAHSRLTVFENNAYEDTIPSLIENSVDISYASSPVSRLREVNFRQFCQKGHSPNMGLKKNMNTNSPHQMSQFPCTSHSFSTNMGRNHGVNATRLSQNRLRRHFSNKERWQPLYAKPKDPETVSMLGYEFANDVIQGHVPPSPLLPAPCHVNVPNCVSERHNQRDNVVANEYTVCKPVEKEVHGSSVSTNLSTLSPRICTSRGGAVSPRLSQPQVGAASTKLSTVSTRRSKRKMKKSRRYLDQLRHRWQRRLPVFNTGFQFGTYDSYGPRNNEKISGYIGNRSHGNMMEEDDFEGALLRHRIQMSETTLLEEIWQHVKMLVERTNQEHGSDDKEGPSERHSDESSAHTVVPSTNEQVDSANQLETSTTDHSSSGISVQINPCMKASEE